MAEYTFRSSVANGKNFCITFTSIVGVCCACSILSRAADVEEEERRQPVLQRAQAILAASAGPPGAGATAVQRALGAGRDALLATDVAALRGKYVVVGNGLVINTIVTLVGALVPVLGPACVGGRWCALRMGEGGGQWELRVSGTGWDAGAAAQACAQ